MKLKSLEVRNLGPHIEQTLSLPDGLSVVYGPNETGKSTFVAGLRGLLFGRPELQDGVVTRNSGAMGRGLLLTQGGEEYVVERSLLKKSAPKIHGHDGTVQTGQAALRTLFPELQEVEETVYNGVFSVQLADLVEASKSDRLTDLFYGHKEAHLLNPGAALRTIQEHMLGLFSSRANAKNPPLNQALRSLAEITAQLRKSEESPRAFERRKQERDEKRSRREHLQEAVRSYAEQYRALEIDEAAWPIFQSLQETESEWESLKALAPSNGWSHESMNMWCTQVDEGEAHLRELERDIEGLDKQLSAFTVQGALIEAKPMLDRMRVHLRDEMNRLTLIADEKARIVQIENRQKLLARKISRQDEGNRNLVEPGAEALFERFTGDLSRMIGDEARLHSEAMRLTDDEDEFHRGLRAELGGLSLLDAREKFTKIHSTLVAEEERLDRDADILDEVFLRLDAPRHDKGRRSVGTGNILLAASLGVFVLVSIISFIHKQILSGILPLAGLAAGLVYFAGLRSSRHHAGSERTEVSALLQQLHTVQETGFTAVDKPRIYAMLRRERTELERRRRDLRDEEDYLSRVEREGKQYRDKRRTQEREQSIFEQSRDRLLREIEKTFGITASKELSSVQLEMQALRDFSRLEQERVGCMETCHALSTTLRERLRSYAGVLRKLDGSHDLLRDSEETTLETLLVSVEAWVDETVSRAERELEKRTDREQLLGTRELRVIERDRQKQYLDDLQEKIRTVFEQVNVDSIEKYEEAYLRAVRRDVLQEKREALSHQLAGMYGSTDESRARGKLLFTKSQDEVEQDVRECKVELERTKSEYHRLTEEIWADDQALAQMSTSRNTVDLLWKCAETTRECQELGEQWLVRALAEYIVRTSRDTYERNHQPDILRDAAELFSQMTSGKYQTLLILTEDNGTRRLYTRTNDGQNVLVSYLSRGTRDQLYLSLRLAAIKHYRRREIVIPVVLDDILVNFDEQRMIKTFEILCEFSRDMQILYFTCQERIRDLADGARNVHLVSLVTEEEKEATRV